MIKCCCCCSGSLVKQSLFFVHFFEYERQLTDQAGLQHVLLVLELLLALCLGWVRLNFGLDPDAAQLFLLNALLVNVVQKFVRRDPDSVWMVLIWWFWLLHGCVKLKHRERICVVVRKLCSQFFAADLRILKHGVFEAVMGIIHAPEEHLEPKAGDSEIIRRLLFNVLRFGASCLSLKLCHFVVKFRCGDMKVSLFLILIHWIVKLFNDFGLIFLLGSVVQVVMPILVLLRNLLLLPLVHHFLPIVLR